MMLLKLFWLFLRLGFFSVGGGYPMMALILQMGEQAVGLTPAEFADMTALEMLASGPIAINAATYIGYIKGGLLGSVVATFGVCASPVILTTIVYFFLRKFKDNKYVAGALGAIKIACGGVLITTVFTLGQNILMADAPLGAILANPIGLVSWMGLLICGACVFVMLKFKANPIAVIMCSGVAGAFLL